MWSKSPRSTAYGACFLLGGLGGVDFADESRHPFWMDVDAGQHDRKHWYISNILPFTHIKLLPRTVLVNECSTVEDSMIWFYV